MEDYFKLLVVILASVVVKCEEFTSKPQAISVKVGENITIPCSVDIQKPTLSWLHNSKIVFFRKFKAGGATDRHKIIDQYTLYISNATLDDEGEYDCQAHSKSQKSTVSVNVPPSVAASPLTGMKVKPGASFSLECDPSGKPYPKVKWEKLNDPLFKAYEGHIYLFTNISKRDSGDYKCTADNGVDPIADYLFPVSVEYPPSVRVIPNVMRSGRGQGIVMYCNVDAHPIPSIIWNFNGKVLDDNNTNVEVTTKNNAPGMYKSMLQVIRLAMDDFGNYTCLATNEKGVASSMIHLTGLPTRVTIDSKPQGSFSAEYDLEWSVESHDPPTDYRLHFRKAAMSENDTVANWTETAIPPNNRGGETKQTQHQVIEGLKPKTTYEVTVKANNIFGWGLTSHLFRFTTAEDGKTRPPYVATTEGVVLTTEFLSRVSTPGETVTGKPYKPTEPKAVGDGSGSSRLLPYLITIATTIIITVFV